ncbi:hypothetical protein BDY21DRAFT_274547, partial [Lineolata rhizophorae]
MDDEREEELSSITAIFPELAIDAHNPFEATIDLTVAPSTPLPARFCTAGKAASQLASALPTTAPPAAPPAAPLTHLLSYLPPLHLSIVLPDGYPSDRGPLFSLTTSPDWLPPAALDRLRDEGTLIWEEYGRGQVVFAYIDFLQQAAERGFDLMSSPEDVLELPPELEVPLLDHDKRAKKDKFDGETFDCGICLEPKKGAACHRMRGCGHVFCVGCLQDFYACCITEGDVANVRCLDPGCGKEEDGAGGDGHHGRRKRRSERTLSPAELLEIPLPRDAVRRYVDIKRKKKAEADKNTIYCPRKWCQAPARSGAKAAPSKKRKPHPAASGPENEDDDLLDDLSSDSDAESEPDTPPNEAVAPADGAKAAPRAPAIPKDRLFICSGCSYAFCRVCLSGWHGDFERCWPRSAAELTAEEAASRDYMRLHTSPCPTCAAPSQKTHGCNHMVCFQCRTHFCYLCTSWLDPENPYEHFNSKLRVPSCYMKLWELEEGDEGPRGGEGAA